jgi:prepilin-type N-terminal cleavage/methylation domain-containing protein
MTAAPAARSARGFTLVELMLVIGIIAILSAVVIGGIISGRNVQCAQLLKDAKTALTNCEGVLTNPDVSSVADCAKKAQDALTAFCTGGCTDTTVLQPMIDTLNRKIASYKENLSDTDKAKISTVSKPC